MIRPEVVFLFGAGKVKPPNPWSIVDTPQTCRIYYIHGGRAFFRQNGLEYELLPGKLYFFPPNLPFDCRCDLENPIMHTFFDFITVPPVLLDRFIELDAAEYPELRCLIEALDRTIERDRSMCFDIRGYNPLIAELDALISVVAYIAKLEFVGDGDILRSLELIHSRYSEKLSVGEIAGKLGFSRDYFIRKFRSKMNVTPYAYIKSLKLSEAERMRAAGIRAEEIAERLGYCDSAALRHAEKKPVSIK